MTGSPDQYTLRWNNHSSNQLLMFDHLFQTESMTDVTLSCEGTSVKCHKLVLAACSSYFHNLFKDQENHCCHPLVILSEIKLTEVKALLEYMYRGKVNVSPDQLAGLLKAAEMLRIKGLVEEGRHQLIELSPKTPRQSPNQTPAISSTEFQSTSNSPNGNVCSKSPEENLNYMTSNDTVTDRSSSVTLPMSNKSPVPPSPKHKAAHDDTNDVPLNQKELMGHIKNMPILRMLLGHAPILHNAEPGSQEPPESPPIIDSLINSYTFNGPFNHNDQGHDDNLACINDPGEKPVANQASYVPGEQSDWKKYKRYTETDLMGAIEAVRHGMSPHLAGRKFSVPSRTIYDKVKKLGITINSPKRKKSSPIMSTFQKLNLRTGESSGSTPEQQSSEPPWNGNGTGSISVNGSETDYEKMEAGSDVTQLTSPSLNDNIEDSNHIHDN